MTVLLSQPRQIDVLGVFEDFRRRLAFGVAQDPVAVVQVAVQFHEADGDEPVEPGVGHRLHRLPEAVLLDPLLQLLPLLGDRTGNAPGRRSAPRHPVSMIGSIFLAVSP